ncbi:3-hydroxymethyl-3-methylglutaryl-CoA lyase [Stagonosporopsis vannaccii]|nr:3-hydroxymethyl-3-methylglutaryl-CoA lyase [Stagonosporopsis vannaccii]
MSRNALQQFSSPIARHSIPSSARRPISMTNYSTGNHVRIVEVGPRDGLQNICKPVPTRTKVSLIQQLHSAGMRNIEVTSAVSPRAVPQLADYQEVLSNGVIKDLIRKDDLRLPVLVPNKKGLDLAMRLGIKEVAVFVSASEGFSRANTRCSVNEGLARAREVVSSALGAKMQVRGYISCIFHDPYDGPTPEAAVLHGVQKLLEMGCYEVSLGDTVGIGAAADVQRLLRFLFDHGIPAEKLAGHFHDTYGQAVSNVWTAYELGLRTFDSSVAGLGGCPFAPGAKGNVASEDLVYLFERAGVQTGIDLRKLVLTGSWISAQLGKENSSRVGAALGRKYGSTIPSATLTKPLGKWSSVTWSPTANQVDGLQILRSGPNIKIILDRPKNGNSLTVSMITNLTEFFTRIATDNTISRILLTANGKFFCTGMDLGKDTAVARSASASTEQYIRLTRLFDTIDALPQVTIAAINGPAFGGGTGLAFACDIRIGVEDATFTLSEVKLGLCAATISKYVLREWGTAFTREAMLTARPVNVSELRSLGIISKAVTGQDALSAAADALLQNLKRCAPKASALSKNLIRAGQKQEGGKTQAEIIKQAFEEMMEPGGESEFGLREFQAGRRDVDWDAYAMAKEKSKL